MKFIKIVFGIVVIAGLGVGYVAYGMYSAHEPLPDLGVATHVDAAVYDESYAAAIQEVRARLIDTRAGMVAPALSLAVAVDGELIWAEAQGYADVASLTPISLNTRFPIGSVSKTITAVAAAQLAEQGVLDLDADIHAYVPQYPELRWDLTTRQLLSHQGGVRHYNFAATFPTFSESGSNVQYDTVTAGLEVFAADELLFEPDTDFSYSSYGYSLASAVIEGASGTDFLSYLETALFVPLGMTATQADYQDRPVSDRVSGYISRFSETSVLPEPPTNSSYKWAGGGLISTPTDLARFGAALLAGDLLSAEMTETMFTARSLPSGELNPQHYGLGWRIGGLYYPNDSENIIPFINHGGTSIGGITVLVLVPGSNVWWL